MKKVAILTFEQSLPSTIIAAADIFTSTDMGADSKDHRDIRSLFEVAIVTADGKPIRFSDYVEIKPHGSVADINDMDLVIIPSSGFTKSGLLSYPPDVIDWLRHHYSEGVDIAGACTGVFILGESGLLDDKTATTHWSLAKWFRKRFPRVNLEPEKILTRDGNIYCAGGGLAYQDLCFHLIEKYYDTPVMNRYAKFMLHEGGRDSQVPYMIYQTETNHPDEQIQRAQLWLEKNFSREIVIDDIADYVGLGVRNFKRRFKQATGDTPLVYIQKLRIEAAKQVLEYQNKRIDEIANMIGYEDINFFRRLFLRYTGMNPTEYRKRFRNRQSA